MTVDQARQFKELQKENARLKREVANEAIRLDPTLGSPYRTLRQLAALEGDRELRLELHARAYELAPRLVIPGRYQAAEA
jgi:hypothetical protein